MKKKKWKKAAMIWRFLKPCMLILTAALLISALNTVCQALIPQVIRIGIDGVLGKDITRIPSLMLHFVKEDLVFEKPEIMLTLAAVVILLIAAFNALTSYASRVVTSIASEKFVKGMRDSLYDHIQKLPFAWHVENSTGDIIQRCTSDVETVRNFVTNQLLEVIRIIFSIVFYMIIMFSMNVKITLIAFSFLPVVVLYSGYFFSKIAVHFQEADEAEGALSAGVQENLTGVRVVRAFGREAFERKRFDEKNDKFVNLWINLGKLLSAYWSIGDLITGVQILTVSAVGIIAAVNGEITVGEFMTFVSYNSSLAWPIRSLGRIISEMSKSGVSIDRINYILDAEEEKDAADAEESDLTGDICFEHVNFSYSTGAQVLKDVSFTIPAGKTFAILGNTGSGKSTLVHLLNRLYELPEDQGRITISGKDIRKIPAGYLRRKVGLVLQEPFLFSGTIKDNVGITASDRSLETIREACEIACVDSAIDSFTDGYDTIVGERGVTLSGGQKQRVAIARMLMQHAPVMVFDDSLSAVDAQTDAKIRSALKERMAQATVILISHRITTLMQADCILVLEDGAVAQMGTHKELIEKDGIYKRIFEIQMSTRTDD